MGTGDKMLTGVQGHFGQVFIQLHTDGIDRAAVILVGIGTVVLLGNLSLIIGGYQRGQEAVACISRAAVTLLGGCGGIIPGSIVNGVSGLAIGQNDDKGHTGHHTALGDNGSGGGCVSQQLGTGDDTGLDVGTAVIAPAERIDCQHLILVPPVITLDGNGNYITAGNIFPGTSGSALFVDPTQVVGSGIAGIVGQRGQHVGSCAVAAAFAVIVAGESDNSHTVVLIGLHQGGNGIVGGGDHLGRAVDTVLVHGTGGIQNKHHVQRHTALGGQAHNLGSLRDGNDKIIVTGGKRLACRAGTDCNGAVTDGLIHRDLTGIQSGLAVEAVQSGVSCRVRHRVGLSDQTEHVIVRCYGGSGDQAKDHHRCQ